MLRRVFQFLFTVSCLFVTTIPLDAQWIQTNGPYGGNVTAFFVYDSVLFVTNSTRMFQSTNYGSHWSCVQTDLPGFYNMNSFARIGSCLFAGTYDGGVFRSTDCGASWVAANAGLPSNYVCSVAACGDNLIAAIWGSGIYCSTNSGASWTPKSSGLSTLEVGYFAVSSSKVYVITAKGPFVSTNNGLSWTPANSTLPGANGSIISFCCSDSALYYGIDGTGIFRSKDEGANWVRIDSSEMTRHVHTLFMNGSTLFAGTYTDGIFRSTDNGASWAPASIGVSDRRIDCFAISGTYLLVGTAGGGAYRSSNNGTSWIQINEGMTVFVSCVGVNDTKLYAGTYGGGLFLTSDEGMSWSSLASPEGGGSFINSLVVAGSTIYISNSGSSGHGPDGWVCCSTDNGASWTYINSNLANTNVSALAISDSNLYAGTLGSGVFVTTNNGTSWTQGGAGLRNDTIWALAAGGTNVFAWTRGGFFRSVNFGSQWSQIISNQTFVSVNCLTFRDGTLYASTDRGIFVSSDSGATWSGPVSGLSQVDIVSLAASKKNLFAVGSGTVLRRQLSEIAVGVEHVSSEYPAEFTLKQNFPNPFNPSTSINYSLPKSANVTLRVFNALGQEVALLVNERKEVGYYQATWNANVPSGIYFYRLQARQTDGGQAGEFVETKKMILLK